MTSPRQRLQDILDAITQIEKQRIHGRARFDTDELVQVWMTHYLQIVGRPFGQLIRPSVPSIRRCRGAKLPECGTSLFTIMDM